MPILHPEYEFRTDLGKNVFYARYALTQAETWRQRAKTIVDEVCGTVGGTKHPLLSQEELDLLVEAISTFKFLPGGRYIYYAGRTANFYNNCYLFKSEEDTREAWAELCEKAASALMTGGGIGNDYSVFRPRGSLLNRTGGQASGPIPLMQMINEIGRNVMQGGSRRSAIYASLNWAHEDSAEFLQIKDWDSQKIPGTDLTYGDAKKADFNFPCPLDMTNISLNYDDAWLNLDDRATHSTFLTNVRFAMMNGEPGFSFNFGDKEDETARNACTEVTSRDDSDVCNLGSLNMGAIESLEEFEAIVAVASKFLVCGTLRGDLPNDKIREVREKNRRLGLGLMGVHEWLLKRGYRYEANPELTKWLEAYERLSESAANEQCDRFYISRPVAYRAIAPTGTIGILAGTTGGIEPLYAVAYKRRYLIGGTKYKYEYVVDHTAQTLIDQHGVDPNSIETAADLAKDPERRIAFQAYVQDYVDMAISSTLNLPEWGSKWNNEKKVEEMAHIISKYAPRLRGLTFYPDGARGGQPITQIPYEEAIKHKGLVFEENVDCGGSGVCGI
ncbi:hypothetical protein [Zhongshania sp.]|uniref:hypothetical protein n=1 Tax=Zhongshania sp. TaxID=1971902 RepID=UPI0035679D3C